MVERKTWQEFRECKLLWWINMILHTFGWAIVVEIEDDKVIEAYPARVKYRGFDENSNSDGYIGVSEYIAKESDRLLDEAKS